MSAWATKHTLTLQYGGCSNMAINRMCKQYVTVSPTTLREAKIELGKEHDVKVSQSKARIQRNEKKGEILQGIKEKLVLPNLNATEHTSGLAVTKNTNASAMTQHVPNLISSPVAVAVQDDSTENDAEAMLLHHQFPPQISTASTAQI